jgi:hypothetical protein
MVGEGVGHIGHGCVPLWRQVFDDLRPLACDGIGGFPGKRIRTLLERAALLPPRPVR